ncbi:hypothetical protein B0T20DRAFT_394677 [Sordaria brevicollis]|uniref:Uncharacterized protein n=1 Tax=Sordaria brevicollis TaxID=83679 RepID=A0AAE0PA57_SORBR|nr:hypothetical protein B0T20DRAFT_394677 [Sordaria brevicollis]
MMRTMEFSNPTRTETAGLSCTAAWYSHGGSTLRARGCCHTRIPNYMAKQGQVSNSTLDINELAKHPAVRDEFSLQFITQLEARAVGNLSDSLANLSTVKQEAQPRAFKTILSGPDNLWTMDNRLAPGSLADSTQLCRLLNARHAEGAWRRSGWLVLVMTRQLAALVQPPRSLSVLPSPSQSVMDHEPSVHVQLPELPVKGLRLILEEAHIPTGSDGYNLLSNLGHN